MSYSPWIRPLKHRQKGVVAVEMAMVGLPFMLVLFAVIELGYNLFIGTMLDIGVDEAARQIRTGQVQESDNPLGTFNSILCARMSTMLPCSELIVDAKNFTSFSGTTDFAAPDAGVTTFLPGSAGDIIVVRVAYPWNFNTPLVADAMTSYTGNIVSSSVFRNEPFDR